VTAADRLALGTYISPCATVQPCHFFASRKRLGSGDTQSRPSVSKQATQSVWVTEADKRQDMPFGPRRGVPRFRSQPEFVTRPLDQLHLCKPGLLPPCARSRAPCNPSRKRFLPDWLVPAAVGLALCASCTSKRTFTATQTTATRGCRPPRGGKVVSASHHWAHSLALSHSLLAALAGTQPAGAFSRRGGEGGHHRIGDALSFCC
jgi:hypothetical protein